MEQTEDEVPGAIVQPASSQVLQRVEEAVVDWILVLNFFAGTATVSLALRGAGINAVVIRHETDDHLVEAVERLRFLSRERV